MRIDEQIDVMDYQSGMEVINDGLLQHIIQTINSTDFEQFTESDVKEAIYASNCTEKQFAALLSSAATPFLEEMAQRAQELTRKHFGNTIAIFTPLYISNYCENHCIYCGFNCKNNIKRAKLNMVEIEKELNAIAKTGMKEILILTGESKSQSPVDYIGQACRLASKYFSTVGVEIYPVNSDEYAFLHECGCDYVTVFQETYQKDIYGQLHLAGHKRIFPYRLNAQERALMGGMRGVAFAALLGLADWRKDALATGLHGYHLQRKYPHAEISFSCPRLRPIKGQSDYPHKGISERDLVQIICAYRIFAPFANITVSSRESAIFRDQVMQIAATKVSAGVSTGIGEHSDEAKENPTGDAQFDIADERSLDEMLDAIRRVGMQPSLTDYINV